MKSDTDELHEVLERWKLESVLYQVALFGLIVASILVIIGWIVAEIYTYLKREKRKQLLQKLQFVIDGIPSEQTSMLPHSKSGTI